MKIQDAIDYIEGSFTCELGAPWRWADLMMTKPYQTVTLDNDVVHLRTPEDIEHRLVARLINTIDRIKVDAGFGRDHKPKLFWRWQDKIRIEEEVLTTRIYLDGNPGYSKSNPQKPGGSPAAGQIKLVKDSERMAA